ncbi:hypothetical protein Taro_007079, partial [Colocasia esculenta]|nr:hypothetical protein [Colocasia esculenta]
GAAAGPFVRGYEAERCTCVVRESRRIHVPPVVPISAVVESVPRHQQSKKALVAENGSLLSIILSPVLVSVVIDILA